MVGTNTNIARKHRKYLESEAWKCPKSPTGAHHWIEHSHAGLPGVFYCKWCYEVREFPTTFTAAMTASYGQGQWKIRPMLESNTEEV